MPHYTTEQEKFWAGEFGDEYVDRNQGEAMVASNIALFAKILSRVGKIASVIEFGANIGLNLRALRSLLPNADLAAVEINEKAIGRLREIPGVNAYHCSILDFQPDGNWDLTLIKGVLIHIHPDSLNEVYDRLYRASAHYICVVEYYNPVPVEVNYRGNRDRLFKRDFAGELLDRFADLRLVDYGFAYHRDRQFPQDDITWFLLEKTGT